MHLYDDIAAELTPEGGPASEFPWFLFLLLSLFFHLTLFLFFQQWGRWEKAPVTLSEPSVQLVGPEALPLPPPKPRDLLFGTDNPEELKSIPKGKETRLPPIPKSERPALSKTPKEAIPPKAAPDRPAAPPASPAIPPSSSLPEEPSRNDSVPSTPTTPPPLESAETEKTVPPPSLPPGRAEVGAEGTPRPNGLPGLPFTDTKRLDQLAKLFSEGEKVPPKDAISLNTDDLKYFSYMLKLKSKIEYVWRYPPQASQRGIQGDLLLTFTILKDGRVTDARVVSTSGYEILDQEAVRALKEAAPFAPLPDSWNEDHLTITGHFLYYQQNTALR